MSGTVDIRVGTIWPGRLITVYGIWAAHRQYNTGSRRPWAVTHAPSGCLVVSDKTSVLSEREAMEVASLLDHYQIEVSANNQALNEKARPQVEAIVAIVLEGVGAGWQRGALLPLQ